MSRTRKVAERKFAVLLNQHRYWGTILTPYMLKKEEGSLYYSPEECLSPYASPEIILRLNEEENDLIQLANSYSDRHLYSLFSREKNVVEFLEKVSEDRFEKFIKPYIEKKLAESLKIIFDHKIPVYRQKTKTINLHPEDRLNIPVSKAEARFTFTMEENQSRYSIQLISEGKELPLLNQDIEIVTNDPLIIRHADSLAYIPDLEGKKLGPFLKKKELLIPAHLNERYFSGFVKNIVNKHDVIARGFKIEDAEPIKKAILLLEHGIRNIPSLILKFRYNNIEIYSNSGTDRFTDLKIENNNYTYYRYRRDKEWEESVVNRLSRLGYYTEDRINFMVPCSGEGASQELYSLIESINLNYDDLLTGDTHLTTGSIDKNYYLGDYSFEINYDVSNDWFDLKAIIRIGDYTLAFTDLTKNIIHDKREYILPDGTVFILPEEWFSKYRSLFDLGKKDGNILKIHKQHFSLLKEAFDENECSVCRALEKLVIPDIRPSVKAPSGLNAMLRPYQEEGLGWLLYLQENNLGGCLADDMGLGKTIQTLSVLLHNQNESQGQRETSLIIVPASLVFNWYNESVKYAPSLKTLCYIGNQRKKDSSLFSDYDIIISSYHTVRQDIDLLSEYKFHYAILDESQLIKNPASQLYKAVMKIKSEYRLVLTGTPVENSLNDLWTQLNFVNPGLLGNLAYFKREFARPIENKNSEDSELRLLRLIRPFILRRTKKEVATDLPPITEKTVFCDMTEQQASIYEKEKSAIRNNILGNIEETGQEKSAIMVLQGLMKLRQIANHPALTENNPELASGKFNNVIEDTLSVISEGHRILMFSSFVKHLSIFAEWFTNEGIAFSMLTGSTNNREKIIDEFQSDKENKIFLISLKAGGVGLNLTSADYVFMLDPWWNPAAESQALNRAHRIGQDKNVFVHRYITTGTIEEKILNLQSRKSELAETFIKSGNPLSDLDINEMIELIDWQ